MKEVNTHEAKTHLSRIVEELESEEVYILSRNGKPIAELRKQTPFFRGPSSTTTR